MRVYKEWTGLRPRETCWGEGRNLLEEKMLDLRFERTEGEKPLK